jgi:DNA-binding SARP family transcriptional activator
MAQDNGGQFQLNLIQYWQLRQGQTEIHVAWRQQRLIAALAIHGPRQRAYLSGLLWPERPEARAKESLRTTVHLISSQVPGLLKSEGQVLSLANGVSVDLHQLLGQIKELEQPDSQLDDAFLSGLRSADLLPGWYDDWVLIEQQRLRNIRLRAFLLLARRWLDRGDVHRALEAAESALELEPLHESCVELLMSAEVRAGNRARALRTFEAFSTNLDLELGISPSENLTKLAEDIHASNGRFH